MVPRKINVTEEQAQAMGAVYLGRLFLLHKTRMDALRDVLASEPFPHPETPHCTFADQKRVARAWQLTSAYLITKGRPGMGDFVPCRRSFPVLIRPLDLHPLAIQSAADSLAEKIRCQHCKEALNRRLHKAVTDWTAILVSIVACSRPF